MLNRSSPSAVSCDSSTLSSWLFCVKVMVSVISFTAIYLWFGNIRQGVWLLLQRTIFAYFTKKAFNHIDSWWNAGNLFDLFGHLKWYGGCKEMTPGIIIFARIAEDCPFSCNFRAYHWGAFYFLHLLLKCGPLHLKHGPGLLILPHLLVLWGYGN